MYEAKAASKNCVRFAAGIAQVGEDAANIDPALVDNGNGESLAAE
jgi:hypothetical protein